MPVTRARVGRTLARWPGSIRTKKLTSVGTVTHSLLDTQKRKHRGTLATHTHTRTHMHAHAHAHPRRRVIAVIVVVVDTRERASTRARASTRGLVRVLYTLHCAPRVRHVTARRGAARREAERSAAATRWCPSAADERRTRVF